MGAFIKFLADDPIMLGLCIAIVVLIITFIVVLVIGKRRDEKNSKLNDTSELLKTEVNLDALDSTQQFNATEMKPKEEPVVKVATETSEVPVPETPAVEIPVETPTEPMKLEVEPPKVETPVEEKIPEVFTFGMDSSTKEEEPVSTLSGFPASDEFKTEPLTPIIESTVEPVVTEETKENTESPKEELPTFPTFNPTENESSIIESKVTPIEDTDFQGADSLLDFTQPEEKVVDTQNESKDIVNDSTLSNFEPFNINFNLENSEPNIFDISKPEESLPPQEPEPLLFENKVETPIEQTEKPQEPVQEMTTELKIADPTEEGIFDRTVTFPVIEENKKLEETKKPEETEIVLPPIEDNTTEEESSDSSAMEMEPYNSIYMNTQNIELPEIKIADFSKTAIMRHIPVMESMPNLIDKSDLNALMPDKKSDTESDLEDIDLPKLNPSENTNEAFKTLQGESFDIEQ